MAKYILLKNFNIDKYLNIEFKLVKYKNFNTEKNRSLCCTSLSHPLGSWAVTYLCRESVASSSLGSWQPSWDPGELNVLKRSTLFMGSIPHNWVVLDYWVLGDFSQTNHCLEELKEHQIIASLAQKKLCKTSQCWPTRALSCFLSFITKYKNRL